MTGKTELQKKLLGSRLWSIWLWICIVLSALADVNVLVSLAIQNISFAYTIFPLVLLVLDLALAACAAVSNFRFRHSLIMPIIYGVFTVIVTVIFWIWFALTADYIIFTNLAFIMWIVMQLFTVAVTILSAIRASGSGSAMRITVCVLAILYAVYAVAYIIEVGMGGFFGQAGDGYNGYSYSLRTLGYTYDESTDTYTASAVLSGDGNTAVVPEEFNGKKVTTVSGNLLTASGVDTVVLESEDPVTFTGLDYSGIALDDGFRIYAPVSAANAYRSSFYALAETNDQSDYYCPCTDLGNCVKPITAEGESYISFTYTYENLKIANYEALSDIVVENGKTFQRTLITDSYDYMVHCDESSEEDRCISYTSTNGKILSTLTCEDGNELIGATVTADQDVAISFTDVYRINVTEDNDDVYTLPLSLRYYNSSSSTPYRYVTKTYCDYLLNELESRTGFSYKWEYFLDGQDASDAYPIDDFASILEDGMSIFPAWELNAPAKPVINGSTSITYGDTLQLTSQFTKAYDWLTVSYNWSNYGGSSLSTGSSYTNSLITPADSGTYNLSVTVSAPSVTSLTASSSSAVYVSVAKKSLGFTWTDDANMTYSASEKTIGCTYVSTDVVHNDTISFTTTTTSVTNAGTYTARATLDSETAALYTPYDNTYKYTISPYTLAVTWGETSFTYDGQSHIPEYSYTPLGSDDVPGTLTGAITNAGTGTAVLSITDSNYTLSGETTSFTVEQAPLYITWGETSFTYNGASQYPVAEASGVVEGETVTLYYGSAGFNAGDYTETVHITDGNYYIASGETTDYTIAKAELSGLAWDSDAFTYNGEIQYSVISGVTGLKGSDKLASLPFAYTSTESKDTGSYDTAVSLDTTNYYIAESEDLTYSYTISAYTLEVIWSGTSLTYNGEEQHPTYTYAISTLGGDTITDDLLSATYTHSNATDAGDSYEASLAITNDNYTLSNNSTAYSIAKKDVIITWGDTYFTYNGTVQGPTATTDDLVGTDGVTFSVSDGNTNAGTYTATVTLTSYDNYNLVYGSMSYTIAKQAMRLTWSETSLTYNGGIQYPTVTAASDLASADDFDDLAFTYSITDSKDAGDYTQTVTLSSNNYAIQTGDETVSYVIARKTVNVTWSGATSYTYSGSVQGPSASTEDLVSGDGVILSCTDGNTNAGTYTAEATLSDASNYELVNATQEYTIAKKTVNVTWSGATSYTYNGSAQGPTASTEDLVSGDGVELSYTGGNTNAGTYTARATLSDASNYELANSTMEYTIAKKTVSVTWNGGTSFTYSGSAQGPAASTEDLVSGDGVTLSYTDGKTNAGTYTATATLSDYTNYELSNATQQYTIAKKAVTVSWSGTELTYTGSAQAPTATSVDIVDSVTLSVSGAQTNAGTYEATAALSDSTNYTLSNESCTFTISPKTITIVWDMTGTTPAATLSDSSVDFSYVYYTEAGALLPSAPTAPGSYKVTLVFTDTSNYTYSGETEQSFTIE